MFPYKNCFSCTNLDSDKNGLYCIITGGDSPRDESCPYYDSEKENHAMKYTVVGTFKRSRKDCEGETQDCESYAAAVELQGEWRKSGKYKRVCIVKSE